MMNDTHRSRITNIHLVAQQVNTKELRLADSGQIVLFLLLHIPLAVLMFQMPLLATAHALITFAVALIWTITGKNVHRVAYIAAYIVGSEVLWRMTKANVFWEFSKYALVFIFIMAMLQQRRGKKSRLLVAFYYFALLIPSVIYTVEAFSLNQARQYVSFSLSGPLALMASVWFFANFKITKTQLQYLALSVAGPTISILVLSIWGALRVEDLYFSDGSSYLFSGEFGPNQVSAILSFTVVLLFFYLLLEARHARGLRFVAFLIMGTAAFVSVLTFSRGGPYMSIVSLGAGFFFLARQASPVRRRFIIVTGLFLLIALVLLPYLNSFTGGSLFERFQDTDPSGRNFIIQGELRAWLENPIAGTGPGLADVYRLAFYHTPRNHTEFTRMLAEHGLLGFFSICLLGVMAWSSIRQATDPQAKAFAVTMILWAFLYMAINAMRLSLPSFAFGLAAVHFVSNVQFEKEEVIAESRFSRVHYRRQFHTPRYGLRDDASSHQDPGDRLG